MVSVFGRAPGLVKEILAPGPSFNEDPTEGTGGGQGKVMRLDAGVVAIPSPKGPRTGGEAICLLKM